MIWLRATPDILRVKFARLVAYRAEMAIWILTALLPLVMLALWDRVVEDTVIVGFGQAEMARYFVAALVVRQLTGAWVVWQLNHEIRSGALSARLLRPVHPLWVDALWMLAALPLRLVILLPILAGVVLWRPDLVQFPGVTSMALFVPSVLLAWAMAFLVQALFGMIAFWIDRSEALFGVWVGVWMVLSGYIAPLALFPAAVQGVLSWLPFRGMLAVPVELLSGLIEPAQALRDVGLQVVWTALLGGAALVVWRRGLRRYGAFGA